MRIGLVRRLHTLPAEQPFAVLGLLVRLDHGAAVATAREGEILETRALEVVFLADAHALHGEGDAVKAEAAGGAEEEALGARGISMLM